MGLGRRFWSRCGMEWRFAWRWLSGRCGQMPGAENVHDEASDYSRDPHPRRSGAGGHRDDRSSAFSRTAGIHWFRDSVGLADLRHRSDAVDRSILAARNLLAADRNREYLRLLGAELVDQGRPHLRRAGGRGISLRRGETRPENAAAARRRAQAGVRASAQAGGRSVPSRWTKYRGAARLLCRLGEDVAPSKPQNLGYGVDDSGAVVRMALDRAAVLRPEIQGRSDANQLAPHAEFSQC